MATHVHNISNWQQIKFDSVQPKFESTISYGLVGQDIYYFFTRDNYQEQVIYNVVTYEFNIPKNWDFTNLNQFETVNFIANPPVNPKMQMLRIGKLCSYRLAAFNSDNTLFSFKANNKHYIPVEGIYDELADCIDIHEGLKQNQIHGYFIELNNEEYNVFQRNYNLNSKIGTNICPGSSKLSTIYKAMNRPTEIFIYGFENIIQ